MNKKEQEEIYQAERDKNYQIIHQKIKVWNEEQERLKKQTPEQKSKREWLCMAKTFYLIRNGFGKEPNEQRVGLIKQRLFDFFSKEENKKKAWASREIYEDLLPPKQGITKKEGWQSVGSIIKEK